MTRHFLDDKKQMDEWPKNSKYPGPNDVCQVVWGKHHKSKSFFLKSYSGL